MPMMIVAGLFDQEDIYGGPALYKALAPKDPRASTCIWCSGPGITGRAGAKGARIGAIQFEGDTAGWFRRERHAAVPRSLSERRAEARDAARARLRNGRERVARLRSLAACLRRGLRREVAELYLQADGKLGFEAPRGVEDRVRRVHLRSREAGAVPRSGRRLPSHLPEATWGEWLVDDQRHAASRTDVLVYSRPSR